MDIQTVTTFFMWCTVIDGAILIAVSLAGLVLVARPTGIGRFQGGVLVTAYTLYVATAFGVTH